MRCHWVFNTFLGDRTSQILCSGGAILLQDETKILHRPGYGRRRSSDFFFLSGNSSPWRALAQLCRRIQCNQITWSPHCTSSRPEGMYSGSDRDQSGRLASPLLLQVACRCNKGHLCCAEYFTVLLLLPYHWWIIHFYHLLTCSDQGPLVPILFSSAYLLWLE